MIGIGRDECQECTRLLDDVMKASDSEGFDKFMIWMDHANSDKCERKKQ